MPRIRPQPHGLKAWLPALALLSGCAVGPDFHRPAPPAVTAYTPPASAELSSGPRLASGEDVPADWWKLYRSPALDALVGEALKANPDLAAARAALRAAQQTYLSERGALLPTVSADYNVSRQNASATIAPPLSSSVNPFTLHTAQVEVAYTLDVFGGVRRQVEQARAQAEQQRFQTRAAYIALTANVVATAIQQASLDDQIEATKAIIGSDHDVLTIMRRQYELGQIAGADLAVEEAAVAAAEQTLPPLEKQLAQTRDLMADLTGRPPSDPMPAPELSALAIPDSLPVSLPAKLVDQRPDVRAAEENLHAASAAVGIAIAARLPNLTLSANAGGQATNIANLFTQGNGFWTIAGDAAQPIFAGGALYHRQKAAEAALDQAKAQYRSAVLAALQNVADSLQALDADARDLVAASRSEDRAAKSLAIVKRQLQLGQVSAPTVLAAEQAYQAARLTRVQAEASRYADVAALFQSLGGGWWNAPGPEGPGPASPKSM